MDRNQTTMRCEEFIKRIDTILKKEANNTLQIHGVTFSQIHMLMALYYSKDGSNTLKELEKYFGIAQSSAAGIAARLEKKNLILAFVDPYDKRIKRVQITEKGAQICISAKEAIEESERRLLADLTPEEKIQFRYLLKKVYDSMK